MQAKKVRSLFSGFALVVGLAILAAPAFGQGVQFQVSSLPQQARFEGLTETMGAVVIQATAPGTVSSGSSVTVLYSGTISSPVSGATGTCNMVSTLSVNCTLSGAFGGTAMGSGAIANTAVTVSGNALTIAFTMAKTFALGDSLVISQVRVNVNGLGTSATTVTATLSGTSATPTTNPITFTNATVPVASIVNPSLTVAFNGNSLAQPNLQTCGVSTSTFNVLVTERFPAALTTIAQEQSFTPSFNTPAGTSVIITLSGVPSGMGVQFSGINAAGTTGNFTTGSFTNASSSFQAGNGSYTFTTVGGSTATSDAVQFDFRIGSTNSAGTALSGTSITAIGTTQNITATVSLGLVQAASVGPASFASNTQATGTIATIGDCVTNLLFPFVTNQVGFDTSLQISNTSSDALAFATGNATKANGVCTMTLYPTDLTTQTATSAGTVGTPSQITTPNIPTGGAYSVLQSGTSFKGQSGYVLAVCRFLDAHGFSFVTNGPSATATISQGLLALVIPNNTISNGRVNSAATCSNGSITVTQACTCTGCGAGTCAGTSTAAAAACTVGTVNGLSGITSGQALSFESLGH